MSAMSEPTKQDLSLTCQIIVATVLLAGGFYAMKSVLIPFVIATLIVIVITPLMLFSQHRLRLPRWLVLVVGMTIATAVTILFWVSLYFSIKSFADGADVYQDKTLALVTSARPILEELGIPVDTENIRKYVENIPIFDGLRRMTASIISLMSDFFIILIIVLFMASGQGLRQHDSMTLFGEISTSIQKYVSTKVIMSLATALFVGLFLYFLHLDLAFMFGMLTFALNFIPSVGSILAVLLPIPVALLQFGFGLEFLSVIIIPGTIQFAIGNIIEPKIIGESMGLHPVTLIVALIFWGQIWGVPGMFLAAPLTSIIYISCRRVPFLKPVSTALSGNFTQH